MGKLIIGYWSQSGNTEAMAQEIGKAAKESGADVSVLDISRVSLDELKNANKFALGCPAMGDEALEEGEMEPFVEEVEKFASGKNIGLFGSYGWGTGEWMEKWQERMEDAGAIIVNGEGVIAQESPDEEALGKCRQLGKKLSEI